mgnify:CR=1 FL=1
MSMEFIEYPDREMLSLSLADKLASQLAQNLRSNEAASLCVPGGTTPIPIFETLSGADLDWDRVTIFLGDERRVDGEHKRSNGRLLRRHLLRDKDLTVSLRAAPVELVAPLAVVQAAIGNLLRNAIENSDRGVIELDVRAQGVVCVRDPGHGMPPEEIAAIYARMARGQLSDQGGIGLALVARLCEHLGWTLHFSPVQPRGTLATLDLGASRSSQDAEQPLR